MNKNQFIDLIDQCLSTRQISSILQISQTNTRYWLKKYDLITNPKYHRKNYHCWKCGETDPNKFYCNKKSACAKCHNIDVGRRGALLHLKAVEYLGGKCRACGYNKYVCSLDVHHIDPSTKDPNFSSWRNWSWKRAKVELHKCILLCRNCHQAIHSGYKLDVVKPRTVTGLEPGSRRFESYLPEYNRLEFKLWSLEIIV